MCSALATICGIFAFAAKKNSIDIRALALAARCARRAGAAAPERRRGASRHQTNMRATARILWRCRDSRARAAQPAGRVLPR